MNFCVLLAAWVAHSAAWAQEPPPPTSRPTFEVVSVKECKDTDRPMPSTSSRGRLGLSCWPLSRLIAEAYETFASGTSDPRLMGVPWPLDGSPQWANSARYSIDARAATPESGAMMRGPMMQALLEDRFRLKIHRETKEVSAYLMTVDKRGLKLKPTLEGSCTPFDPADLSPSAKPPEGKPWCAAPVITRKDSLFVFDVRGVTLSWFARQLHPDGMPVIDRTGLTQLFDIHLEFEPGAPNVSQAAPGAASDPSPHASAISATRDQLGLRLTPGKGMRELLIIEHVERPSGN